MASHPSTHTTAQLCPPFAGHASHFAIPHPAFPPAPPNHVSPRPQVFSPPAHPQHHALLPPVMLPMHAAAPFFGRQPPMQLPSSLPAPALPPPPPQIPHDFSSLQPGLSPFAPPTLAPLVPWPGYRQQRQVQVANPNGVTNVFIRLLPPQTQNSDLAELGSRFGRVVSVRVLFNSTKHTEEHVGAPQLSIGVHEQSDPFLDQPTSRTATEPAAVCRGVGFILFRKPEEAQRAVIGLNKLGFEASYARESPGLKLRRLGDHRSTNLYISNVPLHYSEEDLTRLLAPATVLSARILREDDELPKSERGDGGNSRGIGFVRLEDRDSADNAIQFLNGSCPPDGLLPLKVRYADTREQKDFKAALGFRVLRQSIADELDLSRMSSPDDSPAVSTLLESQSTVPRAPASPASSGTHTPSAPSSLFSTPTKNRILQLKGSPSSVTSHSWSSPPSSPLDNMSPVKGKIANHQRPTIALQPYRPLPCPAPPPPISCAETMSQTATYHSIWPTALTQTAAAAAAAASPVSPVSPTPTASSFKPSLVTSEIYSGSEQSATDCMVADGEDDARGDEALALGTVPMTRRWAARRSLP